MKHQHAKLFLPDGSMQQAKEGRDSVLAAVAADASNWTVDMVRACRKDLEIKFSASPNVYPYVNVRGSGRFAGYERKALSAQAFEVEVRLLDELPAELPFGIQSEADLLDAHLTRKEKRRVKD